MLKPMVQISVRFILVLFIIISCNSKKDVLPDMVYNLQLVKTISGEEAENLINKLHFNPVTTESNEIGFYENLSASGVIYITHYKTKDEAKLNFEKMTRKISPENSVFIYPEFFEYRNNIIYKCFGMGKTHFVFSLDKELYWISIDTNIALKFFQEYYSFID